MSSETGQPGTTAAARELTRKFDEAAASYDRLVGANPGYHAHLRRSARRMQLPDEGAGLRLLDVGCGTGASTAALLAVAPEAEIVAVDASAGMLKRASAKDWPGSVRFVHAPVERLAEGLADAGEYEPFDGILAAYLIRNVADPDRQLAALRDLLRPGGVLAVHEYCVRDNPRARLIWNAVSWSVIIPAGRLLTGDAALYRYLWRSVLDFDSASRLRQRMREAGLVGVRSASMSGWQREIVHTFVGRRSPEGEQQVRGAAA